MKKTTQTRTVKSRKAGKSQSVLSDEKLRKNVAAYMQAEEKLLAKYGLAKRLVISFPYNRNPEKIPFVGRLAQKLLTWSRAVLDTQFGIKER